MMFIYFLLFTALGIFFGKATESDPKMGVGWILAIAVFWGFVSAPIWGLAALGEMLLGFVIATVIMPKKPATKGGKEGD